MAATRNGSERNATHFGRFFVEALTSEEADLNKNNTISIQEAFDFADRGVTAYFENEGKLATEHPQLRGAGAAQFSLARLSNQAVENVAEGSLLSQLLKEREELDAKIEDLQLRRAELSNADYLQQLQALVLQSAELSEKIDAEQARQNDTGVIDGQDESPPSVESRVDQTREPDIGAAVRQSITLPPPTLNPPAGEPAGANGVRP